MSLLRSLLRRERERERQIGVIWRRRWPIGVICLLIGLQIWLGVEREWIYGGNNATVSDGIAAVNCSLMRESLLDVKECYQEWNISGIGHVWPLLITATPRSGTTKLATVLRSVGLQIAHDWVEKPGRDGSVSWILAFNDSSYYGPTKIPINGGRFSTVLHLIRDPLKSVTSMSCAHANGALTFAYISRHIPIDGSARNKSDMIRFGMEFYYNWHMRLLEFGFPILYLEAILSNEIEAVTRIAQLSGLTHRLSDGWQKKISKKTDTQIVNARPHRHYLNWNDLFAINHDLASKIFEMSTVQFNYTYDWTVASFSRPNETVEC